jgi:hypothetical protein
MSSVREDLKELSRIYEKLKAFSTEIKELRDRKKELETNLIDYLQESEQVGLRYESFIFFPKDKKIRKKLKKKEREETAIRVLEDYGVNQPKEAYDKLMDSMKGEEEIIPVIKMSEQKEE